MSLFSIKKMKLSLIGLFINEIFLCLIDNARRHIILKGLKYISYLMRQTTNVNSICDHTKLIKDIERVHIILPKGITFVISDALYSKKSQ